MTDFPRTWTLSENAGGAAASITVPGIPGVVHVLDAFTVKVANTGAASVGAAVALSSSDGAFASFQLGRLAAAAAAAGSLESDSASGSGLDLAPGPGASLTISVSAAFSGGTTLLIQGHDI